MMKKVSSLLLVLVLLLGICCVASADESNTPVWESDFSAGTLEDAGMQIQFLPEGSKASWDIIDLNGTKTLRGQIAMFNDTLVRLSDKKYKDVTIEAMVNLERGNALSILGRLQDDGRAYAIILDQHDGIKLCTKNPYVAWKTGGMVETDTPYHVAISICGTEIKAKITNMKTNESITHEMTNEMFAEEGYVGFGVFGFDNDAVSTATGLFWDMKVYEGAVDLDTLGPKKEETPGPTEPGETEPGATEPVEQEPDFELTAKYTDVSVDNVAKKVTLTQSLTVAELKSSFDAPKGYAAKVVDANGGAVADDAAVTSDMKLVYSKDGADDQVYAIAAPASGDTTWVIIAAAAVVVAAVVVVVVIVSKKKKA